MHRLTADALLLAAEWLDCYEPPEAASDAERALPSVAEMLRARAERAEAAGVQRQAARELGVPVQELRRRLRQVRARGGRA